MVTKRVIVPPRYGEVPTEAAADPMADTRPPDIEPTSPAPAPAAMEAAEADDAMLAALAPARPAAPPAALNPFLPLLLATASFLLLMGFQTTQLLRDREAIKTASAQIEQPTEKATKLRNSLDALAADTQRLADAGNASAQRLIVELRNRGVTINPAANTK